MNHQSGATLLQRPPINLRRKQLKQIGSGLLHRFVSRNNDYNGYWAIGQLRLSSDRLGVRELTIDLLAPEKSTPATDVGIAVAVQHQAALWRMLDRVGMPHQVLVEAAIRVKFMRSLWLPPVGGHPRGRVFECALTMTDDLGRSRSVRLSGSCDPHNPRLEHRSIRHHN